MPPLIDARQLEFAYPDGTAALRGVSVQIWKGELVTAIGHNGSGKTTLAKCLSGVLRPAAGDLLIDGMEVSALASARVAERVSYVFQNPDHQIFHSTVRDEIGFGPTACGMDEATVRLRVQDAATSCLLPIQLLDAHPYSLPKGMRQRVALASAISLQPESLILDEPTTGQDAHQASELMAVLMHWWRDQQRTIVIVTNDVRIAARYTQRIIALKDGKLIADGPPRDVLGRLDILQATYVEPPQITRVSRDLTELRQFPLALSVEELQHVFEEYRRSLPGRKNGAT